MENQSSGSGNREANGNDAVGGVGREDQTPGVRIKSRFGLREHSQGHFRPLAWATMSIHAVFGNNKSEKDIHPDRSCFHSWGGDYEECCLKETPKGRAR